MLFFTVCEMDGLASAVEALTFMFVILVCMDVKVVVRDCCVVFRELKRLAVDW